MKSQVSTVDELTLTTNNQNVPFAQYRTSDNKIELTLYKNARTELEAVDATYSITVNTVAKNTLPTWIPMDSPLPIPLAFIPLLWTTSTVL